MHHSVKVLFIQFFTQRLQFLTYVAALTNKFVYHVGGATLTVGRQICIADWWSDTDCGRQICIARWWSDTDCGKANVYSTLVERH
jgi:hypothetical protein